VDAFITTRRTLIAGLAAGSLARPAQAAPMAAAGQPSPSGAAPAASIVFRQAGSGAAARSVQEKLAEGALSIADFGARPDGASDASAAFNAAFAQLSADRTSPPGLRDWGVGAIETPRGNWVHRSPIAFAHSQIGFTMRGAAPWATAHVFDLSGGAAIPLNIYIGVSLSDFLLKNVARNSGTSAAIEMKPRNGGGLVSLKRLVFDGFNTGIRVTDTVNADKTLVEQVVFGTAIGFDQGRNKQAIGWTFLNCAADCRTTHFRLGGAGEVLIANYTSEVYGSLIHYPESSGVAGSGRANYLGSRTTVMSTKLEYHGSGDRMLVDARDSVALTDSGGSNVDLRLRDVSFASGSAWPDPARHVVIQVGNERSGSDAVRIHQDGGTIEGVIKYGSAQFGALSRRWSFMNALRAPDPSTVQFLGPGNHPLMEWRANENVAIDQYRGGQGFHGAIDFDKAYLWHHSGPHLIHTGLPDAQQSYGGRIGNGFAIAFPVGTAQLGLFVYLNRPLGGTDLEVTQYEDSGYRRPVGATLSLAAGTPKGLYQVHSTLQNLGDGRVYVRITTAGSGREVFGALVVRYFPYMGT
jgi:hypothetical protein